MADQTGIEWTDATWNPIRGCSRVSEGCRNCYAESVARRFSGPGLPYEGLVRIGSDGEARAEWNGTIKFVEEHLLDPLRWKRPRRIFVNSMSDLFHPGVTDQWLADILAVMGLAHWHTFQVLTKRPERMQGKFSDPAFIGMVADALERLRTDEPRRAVGPMPHLNGGERWWPLPNVWLGVSTENQAAADERIPLLLRTPAAKRFISAEPLLSGIDLTCVDRTPGETFDALRGRDWCNNLCDAEAIERKKQFGVPRHVDWVIVGGESGAGPRIRPMHPEWARDLRDQCKEAGVPFFFKQWGEWLPWEPEHGPCWVSQNGKSEDHHALFPEDIAHDPKGWDSGLGYTGVNHAAFQRVGKKAAGDLLDGKQWHQFPEVRA